MTSERRDRLAAILNRVEWLLAPEREEPVTAETAARAVAHLRVRATYASVEMRSFWKGELAAHRMVADILDMEKGDDPAKSP